MPDVIVVGAGIVGVTCAWRLAQAGMRVVVFERGAPGGGASQAALGVLIFHAKPEMPRVFQDLSRKSHAYFPQLLEELGEAVGERPDYQQGGQLVLALTEEDLSELEVAYEASAALGIEVERATAEECRLLEPGVNREALGGVFYPGDAWVDNTALTLAVAKAAQAAGAAIERAEVRAVESASGRATGVRVDGRRVGGDWVVVAAGCWSGGIDGVPHLPVEPVRGQALAVAGRPVRRVIASPRGYLVPKREGQTLVGATVERVGFDGSNTLGGLWEVGTAGLEIAPALGSSEFLGAWAGLRPGTPDDLPIIGPFDELPNLIAATGHFRNGILLAPITAAMVRAIVTGEAPPAAPAPFSPDRPSLRQRGGREG